MVLPGTNQHIPLDRLTSAQGKKKRKKTKLNIKQAAGKKRTCSKEGGHPELWRVGEGHYLTLTVNKQAGQRRQEWQPPPSNLGVGNHHITINTNT
jgi:hypothetical protein